MRMHGHIARSSHGWNPRLTSCRCTIIFVMLQHIRKPLVRPTDCVPPISDLALLSDVDKMNFKWEQTWIVSELRTQRVVILLFSTPDHLRQKLNVKL